MSDRVVWGGGWLKEALGTKSGWTFCSVQCPGTGASSWLRCKITSRSFLFPLLEANNLHAPHFGWRPPPKAAILQSRQPEKLLFSGSTSDILKSNDTEAKEDLSGAQVHAHALNGFNTNPGPYVVLDSRVSHFTGQSVLWHHPLLLSSILGMFRSPQTFGSHKQPACLSAPAGNALHHFVHDSVHTFQHTETSMNASLLNPL